MLMAVIEKQNTWLAGLCSDRYPDLRYAVKNGEQCVGLHQLKVNGHDPLSNTAFEFDGCYYHGCECVSECVKPHR